MSAEIGKCGGSGGWPSHLHLEIRKPIGKGYEFWPKPPEFTKEWIAANYADPYGFIEKRKYTTQPIEDTLPVLKKDFENMRRKCDNYDEIRVKLDVEDSKTVILAEIDKFLTYEDKLKDQENQLNEVQAKATEFANQAAQKALELTNMQKDIQELQTKLQTAIDDNIELRRSLQNLQAQSRVQSGKSWYIKILEFFRRR